MAISPARRSVPGINMVQQSPIGSQGNNRRRLLPSRLARLLHKPVQLEDIKAELERAMLDSGRQDVGQTVVANRYLVLLNPRDYGIYMYMQQLADELRQYIMARGQMYGLRFGGAIQVELWPASGVYLRALAMFDSRLSAAPSASGAAMPAANNMTLLPSSTPSVLPGGTAAIAAATPAPATANRAGHTVAANLPTTAMPPASSQRGYTQVMVPTGGRFCLHCKIPLRPGARFCNRCGRPV